MTQVKLFFILNGLLVENQACPKGSCIKFAEKSWYYVGWPNIGMGVPDIWYWAEQQASLRSSRLLCKRAQEVKEEGEKNMRRGGGEEEFLFFFFPLLSRAAVIFRLRRRLLPSSLRMFF